MPLRLSLLGQIAIRDDSGASVGDGLQRRPLAVLALLGVAGAPGLSRDSLVATLWPESEDDRARQSLRQALLQLRQRLHADVIVGTADLRIDDRLLSVDVQDFYRAVRAGDHDGAVALFRGSFLDGFHVRGAPAFEEWSAAEGQRVFRQYVVAVEEAATRASASGRQAHAASLWQGLLRQDPLLSRAALGYATSLRDSGDNAGALRFIGRHEQQARAELGLALDDRLRELQRALRTHGAPARKHDAPAAMESAMDAAIPAVVTGTRAHRTRQGPRIAVAGVVAAALIALAVRRGMRPPPALSAQAAGPVAVLPFHVTGDSSRALGTAAAATLGTMIGAVDTVTSMPTRADGDRDTDATLTADVEAARMLGASLFVTGDVLADSDQIQLDATLRDAMAPDSVVARASASATRANMLEAFTRVGSALASALLGPEPRERVRTATLTTRSPDALRAFLHGEAEFGRQHFLASAAAFRRATELDATFALAWYRLSETLDWAGGPSWRIVETAAAAHALSGTLPTSERRVVDGAYFWRRGDSDEAERLVRSVAEQDPSNLEATALLAEILFHDNPLRGRPIDEARPLFERLVAADPNSYDALSHLHRVLLAERQLDSARALERRMVVLRPASAGGDAGYYDALVRGTPEAVARVIQAARGRSIDWISTTATRAFVYGEARETAPLLERVLTEAQWPSGQRGAGLASLIQMAAARGRMREADSLLTLLHAVSPKYAHLSTAEFALLPFGAESEARLRRARDEMRAWNPPRTGQDSAGMHLSSEFVTEASDDAVRRYYLGVLATALGERAVARSELAALRRAPEAGQFTTRELANALEVELGIPERIKPQIPLTGTNLPTLAVSRARHRYAVARALEAAGAADDALAWYNSFEFSWVDGAIYAVPGHLARARIFARRGQQAEALREVTRARYLWKDADPEQQRMIEMVERQVASNGGRAAIYAYGSAP